MVMIQRDITPADYEALQILVDEMAEAPQRYDELIRSFAIVPSGDPKEKAVQILSIAESAGTPALQIALDKYIPYRQIAPLILGAVKILGGLIGSGIFKGGKRKKEAQAQALLQAQNLVEEQKARKALREQEAKDEAEEKEKKEAEDKKKMMLYGGIAIGVVVLIIIIALVMRAGKKK